VSDFGPVSASMKNCCKMVSLGCWCCSCPQVPQPDRNPTFIVGSLRAVSLALPCTACACVAGCRSRNSGAVNRSARRDWRYRGALLGHSLSHAAVLVNIDLVTRPKVPAVSPTCSLTPPAVTAFDRQSFYYAT